MWVGFIQLDYGFMIYLDPFCHLTPSTSFSFVTSDAKNTTEDEKNEERPHTKEVGVEEKV